MRKSTAPPPRDASSRRTCAVTESGDLCSTERGDVSNERSKCCPQDTNLVHEGQVQRSRHIQQPEVDESGPCSAAAA